MAKQDEKRAVDEFRKKLALRLEKAAQEYKGEHVVDWAVRRSLERIAKELTRG